MTRVLILGGTGWLGHEIAAAALARGAEVTCLARGDSGTVPDGARLVRADRRAPDAYASVQSDWDEVIEIAYAPELVTSALTELAGRAAHWTLVSSVSVYADHDQPLADESAAVVEPTDLSQYPDAKVAAERAAAAAVGDRLLCARPGLIVGPGDPSDRFGYWPARLHRGGRVLIPDSTDRFVQVIDVADLASWIAGVGGLTGVVNTVGDIHPFADFLDQAVTATGFDGDLVTVDDDSLLAHNVQYWSGPRSLPLWMPIMDRGFLQRDGSRYLATGGTLRPLAETLTRTLSDEIARGVDRPRRAGLTPAEEATVLAHLRNTTPPGPAAPSPR